MGLRVLKRLCSVEAKGQGHQASQSPFSTVCGVKGQRLLQEAGPGEQGGGGGAGK